MTENKISTLYLSTAMISTSPATVNVSNSVGYWNSSRQTFGFYVKLRQLLGSNYEKYNKFVISLNKYISINESNMTNAILIETQIGGLSWIDSNYDAGDKANSYWAHLNIEQTAGASATYVSSIFPDLSKSLVFRKGNSDVLIEFRCLNALTRSLAVPSSGTLPTFAFTFQIQPLIEDY